LNCRAGTTCKHSRSHPLCQNPIHCRLGVLASVCSKPQSRTEPLHLTNTFPKCDYHQCYILFQAPKKKLDFGLLPMEQLRKLSVSHKCKDKVMRQRSDFHFALSLKNGVFTTANEASWFFVVLINTVSYFQQIQIIDDAAFAFFLNFFRNSLIYKMLPIGCHVVFQTLD
jgi:hypothetical protein